MCPSQLSMLLQRGHCSVGAMMYHEHSRQQRACAAKRSAGMRLM